MDREQNTEFAYYFNQLGFNKLEIEFLAKKDSFIKKKLKKLYSIRKEKRTDVDRYNISIFKEELKEVRNAINERTKWQKDLKNKIKDFQMQDENNIPKRDIINEEIIKEN